MHKIWVTALLAILAALAPASAVLAGGGGHGGVCMDGEPEVTREVGVVVADNCFRPETIEIEAGQAVVWDAVTPGAHTVTFGNGGPDSDALTDMFAVRFRKPGTYLYSCLYHPGMVGAVAVGGEALDGEALEVVSSDDLVAHQTAALPEGELASSVQLTDTQQLMVKIEPLSALLLMLIFLAMGVGAVAVGRVLRG